MCKNWTISSFLSSAASARNTDILPRTAQKMKSGARKGRTMEAGQKVKG